MAGEIITCGRCGTLPGEPCAGDDGRSCAGRPGDGTDGDGLPIDHLAGARWWTCLVGTTWSVLDTFHPNLEDRGALAEHQRRIRQRAFDTLRRGGIVRHATDLEVQTWQELQDMAARLRAATTNEQRLDAVGVRDTLDAVQLEMI